MTQYRMYVYALVVRRPRLSCMMPLRRLLSAAQSAVPEWLPHLVYLLVRVGFVSGTYPHGLV